MIPRRFRTLKTARFRVHCQRVELRFCTMPHCRRKESPIPILKRLQTVKTLIFPAPCREYFNQWFKYFKGHGVPIEFSVVEFFAFGVQNSSSSSASIVKKICRQAAHLSRS
jgi:hypothetical protein